MWSPPHWVEQWERSTPPGYFGFPGPNIAQPSRFPPAYTYQRGYVIHWPLGTIPGRAYDAAMTDHCQCREINGCSPELTGLLLGYPFLSDHGSTTAHSTLRPPPPHQDQHGGPSVCALVIRPTLTESIPEQTER